MKLITITHSIIIIALITLVSCKGHEQNKPMAMPPASVAVQTVALSDAVYDDEYPATVMALNQVELRPQVSGYITGIHFKDGDRVKKDQQLYSLDAQQYEANYQQSQANLAVLQANLVKAQKDADRYHQLEKQDAVAKQLVDNADAALEAVKSQIVAAKANITGAQTGVKYTNIQAPFDGTIGISLVKLGTSVSAGQTLLNTVSSDDPMAVDFQVDQREILRFTQLQQSTNKANDSTFTLVFGSDAYPHPGKIALIDRAVDPQTGTIKMRLIFPNPKNQLRSGMNGSLRIKNLSSTGAVIVPYKAVTEQLGEYFVYVLEGNKVSQHKVMTGKQIGSNIIIKSGLKAGETLVTEGVQNLHEGSEVTVKKADELSGAKK